VGHSQLDQWNIKELCGNKVRNCGVSGISSFAYNEKILQQGKLNCETDVFIVMHGTNDIVYDYTMPQITQSISKTIDYINNCNPRAKIIFLSCAHLNGRMDRSNVLIDKLNEALQEELNLRVEWVDTSFLDDK